MYKTIAADTLQPINLYTFDELGYQTRVSLAVSSMLEYSYEIGEGMEDWEGYAHFENSTVKAFVGTDFAFPGAHIGIYGTLSLHDLYKLANIPYSDRHSPIESDSRISEADTAQLDRLTAPVGQAPQKIFHFPIDRCIPSD